MTPHTHHQLRLRNLLTLHQAFVARMVAQGVAPSGLERAFAASIEISASLWSQIKAGRTVGDTLAKQIESKAGKATGWLDQVHEETASDPMEEKFIEACRVAWRASDKPGRAALKKAVASAKRAPAVQKPVQ
jgi:hypothetical protein